MEEEEEEQEEIGAGEGSQLMTRRTIEEYEEEYRWSELYPDTDLYICDKCSKLRLHSCFCVFYKNLDEIMALYGLVEKPSICSCYLKTDSQIIDQQVEEECLCPVCACVMKPDADIHKEEPCICLPPCICPGKEKKGSCTCIPPCICPGKEIEEPCICPPPCVCPGKEKEGKRKEKEDPCICPPPCVCPGKEKEEPCICTPPCVCPGKEKEEPCICIPPCICPGKEKEEPCICIPPCICPGKEKEEPCICIPPCVCPGMVHEMMEEEEVASWIIEEPRVLTPQEQAELYLKTHRIHDVIAFLCSHLLANVPGTVLFSFLVLLATDTKTKLRNVLRCGVIVNNK